MNSTLQTYLETRRSVPAPLLTGPGPDEEALRSLLEIAARVPDHGKLAPWRFIIFRRDTRAALVEQLVRIAEDCPDESQRRNRAEKARAFAAAPLVIAVVSAPVADHPKIPLWEQQLSAGAVCLNLLHAAHAHGFSAQWLTGWYAYDEQAMQTLGLNGNERLAGFIHIGSSDASPADRERPDVQAITTLWRPGSA